MSLSTAIIPYTPPKTSMEFIHFEVERGLKSEAIAREQLAPGQSIVSFDLSQVLDYGTDGQKTIRKMAEALKRHSLSMTCSGSMTYSGEPKKFTVLGSAEIGKETIEKIFAENSYEGWEPEVLHEVDPFGNRLVQLSSIGLAGLIELVSLVKNNPGARAKLDGEKIAEVPQCAAGFTIATAKRPIVATYGCSPCVALGGYEATNGIAFVIHFSSDRQVEVSHGLIFSQVSKLAKEKIEKPIQLHLRGGIGIGGLSKATIAAIELLVKQSALPMEIASKDSLSQSLSIDSRTGLVSEYDPTDNSEFQGCESISKAMSAMSLGAICNAVMPRIDLEYAPEMDDYYTSLKNRQRNLSILKGNEV